VNQNKTIIMGSFLILVVFLLRYIGINSDLYMFRDDGIITLSHAKNWVDYGFIGVNPSGGIVEGFSAPLQFLFFSVVYFISGMNYAVFMSLMVVTCTLLMGAVYLYFFQLEKKIIFLIALLFSGFLISITPFVMWHGSGMENAITHLTFLSTVLILICFFDKKKINFYLILIPFLASISRTESIFHIFPVLLIFSIVWFFSEKNFKGLFFTSGVMGLWIVFQYIRYWYFGDIQPNTAYAQDISVKWRLQKLLELDMDTLRNAYEVVENFLRYYGGWFLIFIGFFPFLDLKSRYLKIALLSLVLVLTGFLHPFIFGQSRLDIFRANSHIPIFISLLLFGIFFSLKSKKVGNVFLGCIFIFSIFYYQKGYKEPYNLCCQSKGFDEIHQAFVSVAKNENILRPTIANPDLGIMSWYKDLNVLDLGMLGSPILAQTKDPKLVANYIFNYAAPDLIESHDVWSCSYYTAIFTDPRFKKTYLVVKEDFVRYGSSCGGRPLPVGIWIRKDVLKDSKSSERLFLNKLQQNIDISIVSDELQSCQLLENCNYVSRTVYRFLPEFKSNEQFDQLIEIFSKFPTTNDVDWYLLKGSIEKNLHQQALKYLAKY
jgi:hypothetical protein